MEEEIVKKLMMIAAALLLVVSAAACGSKDKDSESEVKDDAKYTDGTFEGTSTENGFHGAPLNVTVTVADGKITAVEVGENEETEAIGGAAMETLSGKVVEAQGTEGVDAVAGATYSSNAFLEAVNDALTKAAK